MMKSMLICAAGAHFANGEYHANTVIDNASRTHGHTLANDPTWFLSNNPEPTGARIVYLANNLGMTGERATGLENEYDRKHIDMSVSVAPEVEVGTVSHSMDLHAETQDGYHQPGARIVYVQDRQLANNLGMTGERATALENEFSQDHHESFRPDMDAGPDGNIIWLGNFLSSEGMNVNAEDQSAEGPFAGTAGLATFLSGGPIVIFNDQPDVAAHNDGGQIEAAGTESNIHTLGPMRPGAGSVNLAGNLAIGGKGGNQKSASGTHWVFSSTDKLSDRHYEDENKEPIFV